MICLKIENWKLEIKTVDPRLREDDGCFRIWKLKKLLYNEKLFLFRLSDFKTFDFFIRHPVDETCDRRFV